MPLSPDGPLVPRLCRWRCRACSLRWHYSYHVIRDVTKHMYTHEIVRHASNNPDPHYSAVTLTMPVSLS